MKRSSLAGGAVLLGIITVIFLIRMTTNDKKIIEPESKSANQATMTPTNSIEAVIGTTDLPETDTDSQSVSGIKITCPTAQKSIISQANKFYLAHREKDANTCLGLISLPYSQEEQNQLDFWLGFDNQNNTRLYQTPESSYSVTAYTFGVLQDRGQDFDERGSKRCQLSILEDRAITVTTPYSIQSVTRYLDFAIDASGNVIMTAYRSMKDGEKYSGFGD